MPVRLDFGSGKRSVTVKNELRYYESPDGLLVLPEDSPVLQENFQYAFEPKPDAWQEPIKWELHKLQVKRQRLVSALTSRNWPIVPVETKNDDGSTWTYRRRSSVRSELQYLDALTMDYQEQMARGVALGA